MLSQAQALDGDLTDFLQQCAECGSKRTLPKGNFSVSRTIRLHDDAHLCGSGDQDTALFMAAGLNDHMFTNADHRGGNRRIRLENLRIHGNAAAQWKSATERRTSFCNAVYLAGVDTAFFGNLLVSDMLQTALHFFRCETVTVDGLHAEHLGWSGLSTTGSSNVVATNILVVDSGNDHRHSAVHLDGGSSIYIHGAVRGCVGNGVMLDSTFGALTSCLVQIDARACMRGVALIGNPDRQTSVVCVKNSVLADNEIGMMISNSSGAFVVDTRIAGNRDCGILFQGRLGGCDSFISGCRFERNGTDVKQIHHSRNNIILHNHFGDRVLIPAHATMADRSTHLAPDPL